MIVQEKDKTQNSNTRYYLGAILVLLGSICFSAKAVLIKLTYTIYKIDATSLLTLRMLFALPFYVTVAIYLSKRRSNVKLIKNEWVKIAALGITGYYLASIFDFEGLQLVSAGVERLILFIYPTVVVIWSAFAFKKKITKAQYTALLLTYAGMAIALFNDIYTGSQKNLLKGGTWIMVSAITYAGYIVYGGELIPKVGPVKFTCYAMLFATAAIIVHFLFIHGFDIFNFPSDIYWFALIMGIFSTVIPTFMISEGINMIGPGNASIIAGIGPVSTIIIAYLFLNETVTLLQLIGTIIVLIGVIRISTKR